MSRSEANQIARDGRPLNVALTDAGPTPAKLWISPPARAAFPSCERIWTISTERPFSSKIFHLTAANSGTQQRELLGYAMRSRLRPSSAADGAAAAKNRSAAAAQAAMRAAIRGRSGGKKFGSGKSFAAGDGLMER